MSRSSITFIPINLYIFGAFFIEHNILGGTFGGPTVTDVQPTRIGYMGGTITIHGTGFSEDVFNQFDPVLGNKV